MAFAPIFAGLSAAASIGGLGVSLYANRQQQKAAQIEGDMQARAAEDEAKRKQIELAENQRRTAQNQSNFRSTQLARAAAGGGRIDTGSPLSIMAETLTLQQRELSDTQYGGDLTTRALTNQATNARYGAASSIAALKQRGTGLLIEGVGQLAQMGYGVVRNYPRKASLVLEVSPSSSTIASLII